jgi:hypothetical protein
MGKRLVRQLLDAQGRRPKCDLKFLLGKWLSVWDVCSESSLLSVSSVATFTLNTCLPFWQYELTYTELESLCAVPWTAPHILPIYSEVRNPVFMFRLQSNGPSLKTIHKNRQDHFYICLMILNQEDVVLRNLLVVFFFKWDILVVFNNQ